MHKLIIECLGRLTCWPNLLQAGTELSSGLRRCDWKMKATREDRDKQMEMQGYSAGSN